MTRLKSTLLALSLLIASPVFAQTPDVTGDWDVTVTSPQGTNTTPVTFKQEGDKVSGMFKSPQGTLPFDGGTMTGSDLKFTFTINAQGMELPITLTGKVDGDDDRGQGRLRRLRRRRLEREAFGRRDDGGSRSGASGGGTRDASGRDPRCGRCRLRRQVGRDDEDARRRHAGERDAERRQWQAVRHVR